MADNTVLNSGTGGDTIASDDVAGVKYQRVKISVGADGAASDNSTTAPLAVKISDGTDVALVDASGNLQVSLSGTAANGTAVKVDGSAVTQPVSIAATVTVDASGTTVPVDTELTTADLDTGAGTDTRAVVGLVGAKSGGGVLIPGDATKGLAVDLTATGANTTALKVDGSAVTQPVSDGGGTISIDDGAGNISVDWAGTAPPIGAGTEAAALRVTVATDSTGVLSVDDNGASLTVDNGGTFAVQAAQSGTWTVQPGNTANTTAWKVDASSVAVPVTDNSGSLTVDNAGTFAVQASAATSGGVTPALNSIKATATSVKASAGQVYGWFIYNSNSSVAYVQFFDVASGSVTLGTTTPNYSIGIPATSAANVFVPTGIAHGTAITIAATTTVNGSTAPTNNVDINVFYK